MTSLQVESVPIDTLIPYPGNARRGNVKAVAASLARNGQFRPLVVQTSTRQVLAGNHTLEAARTEVCLCDHTRDDHPAEWHQACPCPGFEPWQHIAVTFLDVDDEHARRIVLADNRTSDLASYDEEALHALLADLDTLEGTGYEEADREALAAVWDATRADPDDDEDALPAKGELLALADVAVAEPAHQVTHGAVYRLGRHTLVVARVSDEHPLWVPYLTAGVVFCPYPEPYLTATELAFAHPLLLVQPNRYLAGHLLDKHASMWPGTVEQLA